MLSLKMNDAAVELLGLYGMHLFDPPGGLAPGLRTRAARGIIRRGRVLTWADSTGKAEDAPSIFPNLTAWECADSSFHLEDHVPVESSVVDDAPMISEAGQRLLLLHGVAFALEFGRSALALAAPSRVRCILSANETNATFRFHQIRPGEEANRPDLDLYSLEKMIVLDFETGWSRLQDARGSAAGIPTLLERLRPLPSPAWDEAWARLCPPGPAHYSAAPAALPLLQRLAASWTPAARFQPLLLAGAILAAPAPDVHGRYEAEIATLRRLTQESLRSSSLAEDTDTYLRLLQSLMAFEGRAPWSSRLHTLLTDGAEITCPHCAADLTLDVRESPLLPADPQTLQGPALSLYQTATRDRQATVARHLTRLFGRATCPACHNAFPGTDQLA